MKDDLRHTISEKLWELWITVGNQEIKDELVVRHIPLVEQVAGRMRIGLPRSVDLGELINNGVIGLISAIENFEPERGIRFETYAVTRIRGCILDGLREYDWIPRSIRSKTRLMENTLVKLEAEYGRVPSDEEIAHELEIDLANYYQWIDDIQIASIISLDEPIITPEGEAGTISEMIEDEEASNPAEEVEWGEAKRLVKKLIQNLTQQERLVIALYYYEELTLKEIGEILEISESRVSQIHSKIILTLKGMLRKLFHRGQ